MFVYFPIPETRILWTSEKSNKLNVTLKCVIIKINEKVNPSYRLTFSYYRIITKHPSCNHGNKKVTSQTSIIIVLFIPYSSSVCKTKSSRLFHTNQFWYHDPDIGNTVFVVTLDNPWSWQWLHQQTFHFLLSVDHCLALESCLNQVKACFFPSKPSYRLPSQHYNLNRV